MVNGGSIPLLPLINFKENLTPKQIREKYGERIADRFREMMKVIVFENKSYRIWKLIDRLFLKFGYVPKRHYNKVLKV